MPCRSHLAQLREHQAEFQSLNVAIYAVTFESPERVDELDFADQLPFPLLRNPNRDAFRRFGLGRRAATTIWGPATLWFYARRLLVGDLPSIATDTDPYQLGGDVMLRKDRSGGWIYSSAHPADRPSPQSILKIAADLPR
jgi:hypothetical protein